VIVSFGELAGEAERQPIVVVIDRRSGVDAEHDDDRAAGHRRGDLSLAPLLMWIASPLFPL
jgi:hypothetical protein